MNERDAEVFCNLVSQMAPAEVTRFTEWMAEELKKPMALEAKAGE